MNADHRRGAAPWAGGFRFEPNHDYVLLCASDTLPGDIASLGLAPWTLVFDFNPRSEDNGLLSLVEPTLSRQRSIHRLVVGDMATVNPRATNWIFACGLAGRPRTIENAGWAPWQRRYGREIQRLLDQYARAVLPRTTTFVTLAYALDKMEHVRSVLDMAVAACGEADFVIFTDDANLVAGIASHYDNAKTIELPLAEVGAIGAGLQERRGEDARGLPSSNGEPCVLELSDWLWIEEELELVHLGLAANPDGESAFLRGAEVSWMDLALDHDVPRDLTPSIEQNMRAALASSRGTRQSLFHQPGSGATTVAKRVLWNLHREYPVGVLHRTVPEDTAERIFRIASATGLSVLLLVDGSSVPDNLLDKLFDLCRSRQLPVVFFQVIRRFEHQRPERSLYLEGKLSDGEAGRFADALGTVAPDRKPELKRLATDARQSRFREPFHFCLTAFGDHYEGLPKYVADRVEAMTDVQKRVVGYLATAHHYAQRELPEESFRSVLGLPERRSVHLAALMPDYVLPLLVQMTDGSWRTAHDLIALRALIDILAASAPREERERVWRQGLSDWAVDFAEFCRGRTPVPSDQLLEVLKRAFVFRENAELLGTERVETVLFSQLLGDVRIPQGQLRVLKTLVELYPEEAHFWAHLGRFYALEMRDYQEALRAIDRALALEPRDHVLHHMRGMALRREVYDLIDQGVEVADIAPLVREASESFASARMLNPEDEHGYVSEVQMLARILDYAGRSVAGTLSSYLQLPTADPFLREALGNAEDLLDQVRRNREGRRPSHYEETARARLWTLYGDAGRAMNAWDGLLQRVDVYAPPIRRQITWTLLAQKQHEWEQLSPTDVARIASLMQDNFRQEPNDSRNLRIWLQAVRRLRQPPPLEEIVERVAYWKANTESLEATFYLYVLHALLAMEGSRMALGGMKTALEECRSLARSRIQRTQSFEWIGPGDGVRRLVHQSRLGQWDAQRQFWSNTAPLDRLSGYISRIKGETSGEIELPSGVAAFFVPGRGAEHTRFRSGQENQRVTFFLGFSYDGPRAWEVRLEIHATQPDA